MRNRKKVSSGRHKNVHTIVDKIEFMSRVEARRYLELKMMQKAGKISCLVLQPRFLLQPSFKYQGTTIRRTAYIGDFMYNDKKGRVIVEDVKSTYTQMDPVYRLKRKLMIFKNQEVIFKEVIY